MRVTETEGPGPELDTSIAHNARVWNHWLKGKDNFAADRAVGDKIFEMFPSVVQVARADRAFLARAVQYLAGEVGIRQFLDIGTGLPTADNTHSIAQRIAPESRIVYVDNDPLVLVHARALLTGTTEGAVAYNEADAHDPEQIIASAGDTLDFDQPVALMMLGVLNFILDTDEARSITRTLIDALPSGSYVAITHPTLELGGEANAQAMDFWNENATPPITARTRAEIASFAHELDVVEPGIVSCSRWRIGDDRFTAPEVPQFGLIAHKA